MGKTGFNGLMAEHTGWQNVAIGYHTFSDNIFIGSHAGRANTTGTSSGPWGLDSWYKELKYEMSDWIGSVRREIDDWISQ